MRTEPVHRYQEIADYLRRVVASSRAGDRLPSDAELCARFGVSRMTARQAVQTLAAERLLVRRRGEGTFVAPRTVPRLLGSPLSFTASMARRGLRADSRLIEAGWVEPDPDDAEALELGAGQAAIVVERLRSADDQPMAIERAVVHPSCAAVLEFDLERGSLHAAFERLGRIPTRARSTVSARRATPRERRLLGLGSGGVVLSERRTIADQDGAPLERTETIYAAERYQFEAVMLRTDHEQVG